jgi:arylsulfatase A-like enzyme
MASGILFRQTGPVHARSLFSRLAVSLLVLNVCHAATAAPKPNIVYILCDDLGYGDVRCLNPEGKIPTPHMDRLAAGGMAFTDAHSSSAVCTPTRYGILTGRYNWRSRLKNGVLNGFSPRLIETNRTTVAAFLKEQGYATAMLGKWHLGLNWPQNDGSAPGNSANPKRVDYAQPIQGGPTALGFDYFFGISASLDMAPFVFLENDRVTEVPTVEKKFLRKGPAAVSFEAVDVLPTLTRKAVEYIQKQTPNAKAGKPFFLYLPLASPHTPIVPDKAWQGKSGLSPYADFVMQTDATVGAVLDALDKQGLAENTLLIFTSDNGCSPAAGLPLLLEKGHNPNYHFRGHKADIFEGGHRIPFLVRWPARIKAGTSSDQVICLTDFFATCADILGQKLPDTAAEDSVSILPALLQQTQKPLREAVVHHSINGSFSIRQGKWKLELCSGSGGWSEPLPGSPAAARLPEVQLYDLSQDIAERQNLQAQHPEVVAQLTRLLQKYVDEGRSTPGKPQPNTGAVELRPENRKKASSKPANARGSGAKAAGKSSE